MLTVEFKINNKPVGHISFKRDLTYTDIFGCPCYHVEGRLDSKEHVGVIGFRRLMEADEGDDPWQLVVKALTPHRK